MFQQVRLQHGYLVVEANATHMVHSVLSSFDGSTIDAFTLTKPAGWRYQPRSLEGDVPGDRPGSRRATEA